MRTLETKMVDGNGVQQSIYDLWIYLCCDVGIFNHQLDMLLGSLWREPPLSELFERFLYDSDPTPVYSAPEREHDALDQVLLELGRADLVAERRAAMLMRSEI